jgi:transposase InsO family protein
LPSTPRNFPATGPGDRQLIPYSTPVESPESNGISEAFGKTFKRDYIRVNPIPDAATALDLIAGWFEDYNECHPHSGLEMRSPREFIRAQQPPRQI